MGTLPSVCGTSCYRDVGAAAENDSFVRKKENKEQVVGEASSHAPSLKLPIFRTMDLVSFFFCLFSFVSHRQKCSHLRRSFLLDVLLLYTALHCVALHCMVYCIVLHSRGSFLIVSSTVMFFSIFLLHAALILLIRVSQCLNKHCQET